jgi:aryl-alcohol dehydrogenase-like predicted oxidoreductase
VNNWHGLTWLSSVEALAKKRGISMAQVALAWSMSKDQVSAPIVGTTNLANLEDLVGELNTSRDDYR